MTLAMAPVKTEIYPFAVLMALLAVPWTVRRLLF